MSIEKSVKIGIKQLLWSVKKGVKTTYRWVCNGMQFSAMVIKERLKQQRKTTKQFRGREVCIFVHTLSLTTQ